VLAAGVSVAVFAAEIGILNGRGERHALARGCSRPAVAASRSERQSGWRASARAASTPACTGPAFVVGALAPLSARTSLAERRSGGRASARVASADCLLL
jgi:hypothetical protein